MLKAMNYLAVYPSRRYYLTIRIYSSAGPVPEKPLDNNNITIVVGSTFKSIAEDPTKDVLLQLYYPWSEDCKAFAPTYARLAAALAGVPSLVVAKMDITEDEHPDTFQVNNLGLLNINK